MDLKKGQGAKECRVPLKAEEGDRLSGEVFRKEQQLHQSLNFRLWSS